MTADKAWAAVETAANHLEEALNAYSQRDLERAKLKVWEASSEVEYALFLLELDHAETEELKNENPSKKEVEFKGCILKVQDLLKSTLKDFQSKKPGDLLRTLWLARAPLIALQEKIEKDKLCFTTEKKQLKEQEKC
jgi:hypothetical protein